MTCKYPNDPHCPNMPDCPYCRAGMMKKPVQVWLDEQSLETLKILKQYYGANKSDALRAGLKHLREQIMKLHDMKPTP